MLEEEIREICLKYWPFDTWIPRKDMIVGATYICKARNFYVVEWTGQGFKYIRYKF